MEALETNEECNKKGKPMKTFEELREKGPGLWANIHAKRKRGEKMRKKGEKGAPSPEALAKAQAASEALKHTHAALDSKGKVAGMSSNEKGAKDIARRHRGRVVTLTKPISQKKGDMMINKSFPNHMDKFPPNTSATQGKRMESVQEAEYQGRKVTLNKPVNTGTDEPGKSKVYVKDPSTGNVKMVRFGHQGGGVNKDSKTLTIKKKNPARRKSFRARHNCDNPGPKTKARYWSCKAW